jgi:hypothetical protein
VWPAPLSDAQESRRRVATQKKAKGSRGKLPPNFLNLASHTTTSPVDHPEGHRQLLRKSEINTTRQTRSMLTADGQVFFLGLPTPKFFWRREKKNTAANDRAALNRRRPSRGRYVQFPAVPSSLRRRKNGDKREGQRCPLSPFSDVEKL